MDNGIFSYHYLILLMKTDLLLALLNGNYILGNVNGMHMQRIAESEFNDKTADIKKK